MTINHFNESAQNWDTDVTIERNICFAQSIEKHLTQDLSKKRVLDFGCGTGLMSSHFVSKIGELIGIDTSSGMLDKFDLRFKNNLNAKSLCLNMEQVDLPSDLPLFDIIMTGMAFHHLQNPLKVLNKLKKHLNPNGKIFIVDLDEEDGSFHPDNAKMGVFHNGFSANEFESWSRELSAKNFHHEIIYQISKNNREYGIALATFEF